MNEQASNREPLNWIESAFGAARRHRANIVCWRNSRAFLWEMVTKHSAVTLLPETQLATEPMRILGGTRQLVTCLAELKARVFEWCDRLHATDLDCSALNSVCEKHRREMERLDQWKVGGMFSGLTKDPEALTATYRLLEKLSFAEPQSAAGALDEVGTAAESVALQAVDEHRVESGGRECGGTETKNFLAKARRYEARWQLNSNETKCGV